jgi:hypothetical protein
VKAVLRSQPLSVHVALGLSLVAALAMCAVPLLGIQGTESALALGILQPALCAYASAAITHRFLAADGGRLNQLFKRTLGFAALLWLVPVVVLWLDSLRVRNCSPLQGWTAMLLGPGMGIALASLVGTGLALALGKRRGVPLLAAAVPVVTMLRAIAGFYTGPGIFAYGHFFGFFPGTLYDESIGLTPGFLWLRVSSGLLIAALALGIVSCTDGRHQLRLLPRPEFRVAYVVALACALLVGVSEAYSDELGWSSSEAFVKKTLGGELSTARCHLIFPREWLQRDRERIGADCDFRVHQAEVWLGLTHPAPVNVYLYRSPAEKYRLIGAEGTNIAKPWRSEVHISDLGWPNPVLGHEVVHVVARGTGRGPLRISGSFGGLWPNPALIEGVATAAAWQTSGGLTPDEWAHAMLELNMVPPLDDLFGASFLGQQKRLAYTLSGSLLSFVHERWGAKAVRATYATGSLERGVGLPLAQIDAAWRGALAAQPLAANALALARVRFSGGGILSALCPHTLAQLRDSLRADLGAGDDATAALTCDRILTIDPADLSTRASLAALRARRGDSAGAKAELARLERDHAPAPYLTSVRQALADEAMRHGQYRDALAAYQDLVREPAEEDQRRLLQVKALAAAAALSGDAERGDRQARLLFALLVGAPGERADPATAVYLTRELRAVRDDGLPQYLEARQLFFQARFEYAAELLAGARARGLPSDELRWEELRVEAISRLALHEYDRARALFEAFAKTGSAAHASEAADYLARIRFMRDRRKASPPSAARR